LPTHRSIQLISPTCNSASLTLAIHFRWQTLDILLNKSVIISISIFAAVNLASAAGVVLEPPRNQDMVLLRLYVARPRWWIDWRRVDGVSLRLPRRAVRRSVAVAGSCYASVPGAKSRTDEEAFEIERWDSGEPCNVYAVAVGNLRAEARVIS
jgi:hypothetical protein